MKRTSELIAMHSNFRIFFIVVLTLFTYGCASQGPQRATFKEVINTTSEKSATQKTGSKNCGYENILGDEFRLSDSFAEYASNMFFFDATRTGGMDQLNSKAYKSLATQKFKILKTAVITAQAKLAREPYLASFRYNEVVLNDSLYKIDKGYSTKVVTQDCSIFFFKVGNTPDHIETSILQANNTKLTTDQFINLTGPMSLVSVDTSPEIELDRFTKQYKVKTVYFDDMLLRATLDGVTGELVFAQLYTDITFYGDWGSITNAVDTNATHHDVTKIDTDADCSSKFTGCRLTETVGVTLSEQYLKNNQNGFDLRFQGTKTREVTVHGSLVQSLLEGLESVRIERIQPN